MPATQEPSEKQRSSISYDTPPSIVTYPPRTPTPVAFAQRPQRDKDLEAQLSPERHKLRRSRLSGLLELRGSPKSFESREVGFQHASLWAPEVAVICFEALSGQEYGRDEHCQVDEWGC
jgi:hypothetical protein